MASSDFRDGCPIATTLLETAPRSAAIRDAGAVALADWARVFGDALRARGAEPLRAARLAALAVAAIEGALLQARVAESRQPLLDAAEELALAFEAAIRASRT
jgi:TetR/AcrR family transcriptional repressor of lmrAB and yxaGH operons